MNEGTFKRYVIDQCTKKHGLYHHSNTFASRSGKGLPDSYFDGAYDLWVEWKFLAHMPRDYLVGGIDDKKRGCYSTKQFAWLKRRWEARGNAWGIVGLPNRTAVIQADPVDWEHKSTVDSAIPWSDVAARIKAFCAGA
ncbi:MAG TPA: hypothetical protein PKZ27_02895 [Rhodocyclaceae bacterium]|nr:hypothetical protein [Burkholderiaceae bacterium]HRP74513.1 hypothetical protein [Rhodocyclaceae bacterium]